MARAAGDLAKTIGIEIVSVNAASAITKGDIVGFDTNGHARVASITNTTSNIVQGYGVALEDGTASSNIRVAVGNTYVYATSANGACPPFNLVAQHSTTLDVGAFRALGFATTATNSVDIFGQAVGRYMGHEGEEDDPSAATTAEVGILRLGL